MTQKPSVYNQSRHANVPALQKASISYSLIPLTQPHHQTSISQTQGCGPCKDESLTVGRRCSFLKPFMCSKPCWIHSDSHLPQPNEQSTSLRTSQACYDFSAPSSISIISSSRTSKPNASSSLPTRQLTNSSRASETSPSTSTK